MKLKLLKHKVHNLSKRLLAFDKKYRDNHSQWKQGKIQVFVEKIEDLQNKIDNY